MWTHLCLRYLIALLKHSNYFLFIYFLKGYLTSAQLYFKLENHLDINEVIKIVWPYTFNSTGSVTISIYTTTSTTATSSATAIADTSQGYLHRLSAKLNADQWYIFNISVSTA